MEQTWLTYGALMVLGKWRYNKKKVWKVNHEFLTNSTATNVWLFPLPFVRWSFILIGFSCTGNRIMSRPRTCYWTPHCGWPSEAFFPRRALRTRFPAFTTEITLRSVQSTRFIHLDDELFTVCNSIHSWSFPSTDHDFAFSIVATAQNLFWFEFFS